MASAFITEYSEIAEQPSGKDVPVGGRIVDTQEVIFTTNQESVAFASHTRFVRVVTDAKAHLKFGSGNPVATASDPFVPSNTPEYFGVDGGSKIAFYDGSS